jgi:hypothetical protein
VRDSSLCFAISNFVKAPSTGGGGFGGVAATADVEGITATDGERYKAELRGVLLELRDIFQGMKGKGKR